MKERPILFSGPMIHALIEGRKTRTRRLSTQWLKVKKGDLLWVRETWAPLGEHAAIHRATNIGYPVEKWHPSIYMPRWASRITLEATEDARCEHLQDITDEEAAAEGITLTPCPHPGAFHSTRCPNESHRITFAVLWDSLHTKSGELWTDNPEVVVVAFRVVLP